MAETEGKKRGTRSKRAIVVDSLTELLAIELNEQLGGAGGQQLEHLAVAELAEKVAKGLILNAWDLDHHPVADRFTVIWDVPA